MHRLKRTLTPFRKASGGAFLTGVNMSGKVRACNACQRNGRLTCRRYSDKLRVEDVFFFYCPAVFKTSDVAAVSGLGWGSPV